MPKRRGCEGCSKLMQLLKLGTQPLKEEGVRAKIPKWDTVAHPGVDKRSACWSCRQTRRHTVWPGSEAWSGMGGFTGYGGNFLDFSGQDRSDNCLHHPLSAGWRRVWRSQDGEKNESYTDQRVWVPSFQTQDSVDRDTGA